MGLCSLLYLYLYTILIFLSKLTTVAYTLFQILVQLGMVQLKYADTIDLKNSYVVQLDGKILGYLPSNSADRIVDKLRSFKIKGVNIPETLEIVLVPLKKTVSQYPGLYLFTGPARMMRPLMNLCKNKVELVGTFEQVYMDVCVTQDEAYKGKLMYEYASLTFFLHIEILGNMCNI